MTQPQDSRQTSIRTPETTSAGCPGAWLVRASRPDNNPAMPSPLQSAMRPNLSAALLYRRSTSTSVRRRPRPRLRLRTRRTARTAQILALLARPGRRDSDADHLRHQLAASQHPRVHGQRESAQRYCGVFASNVTEAAKSGQPVKCPQSKVGRRARVSTFRKRRISCSTSGLPKFTGRGTSVAARYEDGLTPNGRGSS
jgi:hypothetical protein